MNACFLYSFIFNSNEVAFSYCKRPCVCSNVTAANIKDFSRKGMLLFDKRDAEGQEKDERCIEV